VSVNVRLDCPSCDASDRIALPGAAEWHCPSCEHIVKLHEAGAGLSHCAACGNAELYRKKDFPHGLGMTILVLACVASTVTYWLYDKYLTWAILIGSAAFDGLLYLWVKDVIVCYRCGAEHRGLGAEAEKVAPFELTVHERYRQERLRQEELLKQARGH
jgi:hypothetical protein